EIQHRRELRRRTGTIGRDNVVYRGRAFLRELTKHRAERPLQAEVWLRAAHDPGLFPLVARYDQGREAAYLEFAEQGQVRLEGGLSIAALVGGRKACLVHPDLRRAGDQYIGARDIASFEEERVPDPSQVGLLQLRRQETYRV